ncbi:Nucleolar Complex 2 protein [Coemansia sp. RSA 989]|nr:Nucleolar Complex 2 protein [Coemansia sp. RSA 1086]KAJ1747531.1 Nucleolar Complex 2 protein [Coemansia sp. RSA 1821]KAJ1861545.1 Nucleolar Complex 2 protein [Coemansia sp. RSA 989]KAJ1869327.1 Nucleolar Complex 2 protein [Coemansia sp. RSA 990]
MGKVSKATKKFNRKYLNDELERRRKNKKAQELYKKRELKKSRRAQSNEEEEGDQDQLIGVEEVDDLADFAASTLNGGKEDLTKFMQDDDGDDDDGNSTGSEDLAALLNEDESDSDSQDGDEAMSEDEAMSDAEGEDEEEEFKQQLEAMKEKDPKFFKYMEKHDPASLKILEQADETPSDSEIAGAEAHAAEGTEVTVEMLNRWGSEIKKDNSIKSLKKLLLALYAASHMDTESAGGSVYRIQGMEIFNKTVSTAIRVAPAAFAYHVPVANGRIQKGGRSRVVQALLKSYMASLVALLRQMSDPTMAQYLIKECERMAVYFGSFARHTRDLGRELLRQFGSDSADDGVRISALLALRAIVAGAGTETVDMALKGIYLTYVRHSSVKNMASLPTIQTMRNCGVELYGLDANASYQHAFVYIRQLAIHLRNSMQLRSKESFRAIYNWQFINSLAFWAEVLATYCGDRAEEEPHLCATLESLVYPLVQIITGVARLVPTAKFFPLRIHCLSLLLRLSAATGVYIPVLPLAIEILESPEFLARRPIKSTLKPLSLDALLKAPKEYEHTRVYLESVLESVFGLLADSIAAQSVRIAFPEWVVPATLQLRRWRKRVGKSWTRFSKQLQGLLDKIDQTTRLVQQNRTRVDFGPSNLSGANQFMNSTSTDATPVGAYAASLRKVRAQQRALLLEAEAAE